MLGSTFDILICALVGVIPEDDLSYCPKEEALKLLKEQYGQDFGYDSALWVKWGIDNQYTTVFEEQHLRSLIVWEWKKKHDPEYTGDNPWNP